MSELRQHLRRCVSRLESSVRYGMKIRSERAWFDEAEARAARPIHPDDDEAPEWAASPRRRFYFGIRKGVRRLRIARARLATLLALEEATKGTKA